MSQRRRQLLLAFFAAVILLPAATPVAASPPAPGPSGTPAPAPTPTTPGPGPNPGSGATPAPSQPTPAASNGTNASRGGGGLIDPVAFVTGAAVGVAEAIAAGTYAFLGGITWAIFGIPAVGTPTDPATWTNVSGPFWPVIRSLHIILSAFSFLLLGAMTMHTLGKYHGRALQKQLAQIGFSALMIILGWWVVQFQLHVANTITLAFAPDPSVLFSTPGNAGKFGLTLIVGAIGLLFAAGAMATAAIVVIAEKAILVMLAGLWPLFWAFRPAGGYSDTVAGLGLGTFYGVLGANIFQGIFAWVLWNINWTGLHATEAVGALIGQLIGTGITFVGIPLIVGRNFIPEAMIMFGKPAVDVADDFSNAARANGSQLAANAMDDYGQSARGQSNTNTNTSTPNTTTSSTPSLRNGESSTARRTPRRREPTKSVSVAANDPYLDARSERDAERKRREITRRTTDTNTHR